MPLNLTLNLILFQVAHCHHCCCKSSPVHFMNSQRMVPIACWSSDQSFDFFYTHQSFTVVLRWLINVVSVCSWTARGQGYGAKIHWWCVWWECEAGALSLPHTQDASDSTREGHHSRVYQSARLQVCFFLCFVYTDSWHILSLGNIALMMGLFVLGLGAQRSGALCCQNAHVLCSFMWCVGEPCTWWNCDWEDCGMYPILIVFFSKG